MKDSVPTFLQIDLQNLFYAARNKGQRIDFEKIWQTFHEREAEFLTEGIIYMIRSIDFDSSKFESKLTSFGYNLRIKNAIKIMKNNKPIYRQTDHDILITIDALDRIKMFDKWILMSGDGDFMDLCKYIKDHGKKIEIWSFKESYNPILEPYADKINFIEDKFFYKKPRVNVFGFHESRITGEIEK